MAASHHPILEYGNISALRSVLPDGVSATMHLDVNNAGGFAGYMGRSGAVALEEVEIIGGDDTFNLLGEEDDTLTLRPSIAQGFGNGQRVKAYATKKDGEPLNHAGLMDTMIKLELGWKVCDNVSLSGYVGYSDFLFDRKIRDASRDYEATGSWDDSWNVVAGLALTISL